MRSRAFAFEQTPGLRRHLGMRQPFFLVSVIAFAVTALPSLAAAAVVDPLLVVVETAPGAVVDAVEVRQAITGELGKAVRAPRDPAAPDTPDLLIVAVDRAEIRMSLRAGAGGVVSRTVPAPSDRKARLQSIGWLVGNLARDQVGAIVAPVPAPAPVSLASVEMAPSSRAEAPAPAGPAGGDRSNAVRRERGPRDRGCIGRRRLDATLAGRRQRRRPHVVIDARWWTVGVATGERRPRPTPLARSRRLLSGVSTAGFIGRPDRWRGAGRGTRDGVGVARLVGLLHRRRCVGGGRPPLREDLGRGNRRLGPGDPSIDDQRANNNRVGDRHYDRKPRYPDAHSWALPPGTSDCRTGAVEVIRPAGERRRTFGLLGPIGRLLEQLPWGEVSLPVTGRDTTGWCRRSRPCQSRGRDLAECDRKRWFRPIVRGT